MDGLDQVNKNGPMSNSVLILAGSRSKEMSSLRTDFTLYAKIFFFLLTFFRNLWDFSYFSNPRFVTVRAIPRRSMAPAGLAWRTTARNVTQLPVAGERHWTTHGAPPSNYRQVATWPGDRSVGHLAVIEARQMSPRSGRPESSARIYSEYFVPSFGWLFRWLDFNGTFWTVELYRAFRKLYRVAQKVSHYQMIKNCIKACQWD